MRWVQYPKGGNAHIAYLPDALWTLCGVFGVRAMRPAPEAAQRCSFCQSRRQRFLEEDCAAGRVDPNLLEVTR